MSLDPDLYPVAPPSVGANEPIVYPDSDGMPMADNTRQWDLIVLLVNGLRIEFSDDPNVFVAGDLLWYPVEGDPRTRIAPDALVAFGRPAGHRGSYMQWRENHVAPHVVFEVLSPGNRLGEMLAKRNFYERFGVEEYYVLDPDSGAMEGWLRTAGRFQPVADMQGWISPRLKIRFESDPHDADDPIRLFHSGGARFASASALNMAAKKAEQSAERAEQAAERAEQEKRQAEQEKRKAEEARQQAEARAARLAERLRRLGLDPEDEE
ncbi:MAG TPA: Uma2 family endonuclease [Pirellulales bacterium]